VSKRIHSQPRTNSKTTPITSASATIQRLFGPPQLLEGEDAAAYDELLARISGAIKPVDVIDEMFVIDVATLQWEILRWRRLKLSLIKASLHKPLQDFLFKTLDYRQYRQAFEETLAKILQEKLSQDQAQELAQRCAGSEPDAIKQVEILLQAVRLNTILDRALADRAKDLAQEYARGEPRVIKQVTKVLARSGRTIDDLMAIAVNDKIGFQSDHDHLTVLERIDRLITVAETRRNVMLREIDRRRATLAEALRRNVNEVEGEFEVIEKTPAEAKSAA
jgi:hypothetical protein